MKHFILLPWLLLVINMFDPAVEWATELVQSPDAQQLQGLLMPVASQMQAASGLPKDRRSTVVNHCRAAAGALQALSWLAYTGPGCGERTLCFG